MLNREHFQSIMASDASLTSKAEIVFFHTLPACFAEKHAIQASLTRRIATFARCSALSVKFCGSGQLGFSPHKGSEFEYGVSDLDVAIISKDLYLDFIEEVRIVTNNYTDMTKFSAIGGAQSAVRFKDYAIEKGLIHINSLPVCDLRQKWLRFSNSITIDHSDLFKSISISIYSTDKSFIRKQLSAIRPHTVRF